MAEIIGAVASGITLAGLLKLCLEAFEIIQVARKQTFDYEKLCLRLNIERARLYTWGRTMDLVSDDPQQIANKSKVFQFEELVTNALRMILLLFHDGERLKKRYGCSSSVAQVAHGKPINKTAYLTPGFLSMDTFAESFDNFGIKAKPPGQMARLATKARWVVEDRAKFSDLIQEIRDLIDGLQDITKSVSTAARQEGVIRYSIQQIRDADTLNILTEVCQQDYPDISDAASTKLDVMTLSSHQLEAIEVWMDSTSDRIVDTQNDLESMSITELQQLVRTLAAQESAPDTLSSNNIYDDILQEKDRLIKELEDRIQSIEKHVEGQDAVISGLKDQIDGRIKSQQLPVTTTTKSDLPDRSQPETSPQRSVEAATAPSAQAPVTAPSREIFKSFRINPNDRTGKVLQAALNKYNIGADWRSYALYIVYGNQERYMGPEEAPIAVFKQLDSDGLKPSFMLRKVVAPDYTNPTTVSGEPSVNTTDSIQTNPGWI